MGAYIASKLWTMDIFNNRCGLAVDCTANYRTHRMDTRFLTFTSEL